MGKQVWEIEKYKKWRFESNIRKTFNMELIDGKKLFELKIILVASAVKGLSVQIAPNI